MKYVLVDGGELRCLIPPVGVDHVLVVPLVIVASARCWHAGRETRDDSAEASRAVS